MSDDHLTLSSVCEEAQIGPKWLASATGRSLAQVYRYLSGEATIPSLVWRVLYAKTRDLRIVQLMTGDVPITVVDLVETQTVFERIDMPSLKALAQQRRQQLLCESSILDILEDGKVDKKDAAAVAALKRNHPKMIQTACRIYMAVIDEYERSRQA